MLGQIGVPELLIILVVALLIFGPSKLPSLGKSLGEGITSFKKGLSGQSGDEEEEKAKGESPKRK